MEGKLRDERILILTLSFGAGHVRAAEAIGAEFARRKPEAKIRIVDALENCRFLFRVFYLWTYWFMIRFTPGLWGRFFASRVKRNDLQTAPVWAWLWGCERVFAEIKTFQPDMIVCCEVGASELAIIARRTNLTDAEIINVITDFEAEPIWVTPEASVFAVAHASVGHQLEKWGAPAETIQVCGIPIDHSFAIKYDNGETHQLFGLDNCPIVLIMGGGMGPTRMDTVAAKLLDSNEHLQIVALPGRDKKMGRKLGKLINGENTSLHIVQWTGEVARLMRVADLLITKSGGLTLAESAACGVPLVLFDSIPGPENANALYFTSAGAAVMTSDSGETARVSLDILSDKQKRDLMAESAAKLALPKATEDIVDLAVNRLASRLEYPNEVKMPAGQAANKNSRPVMILTISNGYGHIRLAESLASAIRIEQPFTSVEIIDVADYMSPLARFTHLTAYLWLIKNLPNVWAYIDRFQKKQAGTSPEWFYRRGCRRLFALACEVRPSALVATEVGCCEIAALIKRDLRLDVPLVAVNGEMDADRAWVQPEVDVYSCVSDECGESFISNGAPRERVEIWGSTLSIGFERLRDRGLERLAVCDRLGLDSEKHLVLIAGGSEGIGSIEETTARLLSLSSPSPQIVVLTGRNERLKLRCEALADESRRNRLRVLGWTAPEEMPQLMSAADLMVSKLGSMFYEAIVSELPMVALNPPPGAERVQHRLLDEWGVGRAVRTMDEMTITVADLLKHPEKLEGMRKKERERRPSNAAQRVAQWLDKADCRDYAMKGNLPSNIGDLARRTGLRSGF